QLARVRVQGHDARRVQIHVPDLVGACNDTIGVVEISRRLAGAPIDQVQAGVERSGHPGRASAKPPAIAFPGFVSLFARPRNYVPAPGQPTGPGVESRQVASFRPISAVAANDHLVLDNQRRGADAAVALLAVIDICFPYLATGVLIECDQVVVPGSEEDFAVAHGDTTVPEDAGLVGRIAVSPDQ